MFPFKAALNASTLFPFGLDVRAQARVAAEAGFEGIELWTKDIDAHLERGGSARELGRELADTGLTVANAIAFFPWADADDAVRERGFAQAEREMRVLAEIGCVAVAAPPFGDVAGVSLEAMAAHFARLAELGRRIGVEPYLEFWGRARRLSRLSEALFVAAESGLPDARLLLDPFHMYTGGTPLSALAYVGGANIGIVHVNDYPADPPRETVTDQQRVLPGEGVADTRGLARLLDRAGYRGFLSLELFVESYGDATPLDVARRGLEAVRAAYQV
ncbi:MAG: xylose isomerase [Chloroflexota bacterium]|jgi:sugar phosphate isomerase/epimerase